MSGMSYKLDPDQQKAVDCNRNAVVSAGAGSGKTSVLARRFIRLAKDKKAFVDEILTLTFTRKAAAEMYERIHKSLLAEENDPVIAAQLPRFTNAQISTLDSFCVQIVQNGGQRFGLSREASLDDHQSKLLAEQAALDFILDKQEELQFFLFLHGFEKVWKDFFVSLAMNYLHFGEKFDFTEIGKMQREELGRVLNNTIREFMELVAAISALPEGNGKSVDAAREKAAAVPDLNLFVRDVRYDELIPEIVRFHPKKSGGKKPAIIELGELVEQVRKLKELILPSAGSLSTWSDTEKIFSLCRDFQDLYLNRKREAGILTFRETSELAVAILKEDLPLRRYYKNRFKFIMIDEFQDNNKLQRDLLYLLAESGGPEGEAEREGIPEAADLEPEKLFFVGDAKQSIYRFRGADVSVFSHLADELIEADDQAISLKKNYRSEPGLIDLFNRVFPTIFGEPKDPWDARFEPLGNREARIAGVPLVRIFFKPYTDTREEGVLENDEAEAVEIARFIRETVDSKRLMVNDGSGERPVTYNDFALLMRTTGNQRRFEQSFRKQGIPYTTQNIRSLFLEGPLYDIYHLLQLSIYPEDSLAYAGYLRSPFVNIGDDSFVAVLLKEKEGFSHDAFEALCGEEDRKKYQLGCELYKEVRSRVDREPLADIISFLWHDCGYRYTLLRDERYHGYLEYYDFIHALARSYDRRGESLVVFLDFLRENLGKFEKLDDLDLLRETAEGVQIMTIHKAKGLEFPVVILANTGSQPRGHGEGSAPWYLSEEWGPAIAASGAAGKGNYFYELGKEEEKKKEIAEMKRLLYVALTRAQNHLIISGCRTKNNKSGENILLNMILNGFQIDEEDPFNGRGACKVVEIPDSPGEVRRFSRGSTRRVDIPGIRKLYEELPEITWQVYKGEWTPTELNARGSEREPLETKAHREREELPGISSDSLIEAERLQSRFGTIVHEIISSRIQEGHSRQELKDLFRFQLDEEILEDALTLADRFFDSDLGKRARKSETLESEVPFLYRLEMEGGDRFINGQIDLLFSESGEAVVVDFKTDRYRVPGEYDIQIGTYLRVAKEMTGLPTRAWVFYLRDGKAVEITAEPALEELVYPEAE